MSQRCRTRGRVDVWLETADHATHSGPTPAWTVAGMLGSYTNTLNWLLVLGLGQLCALLRRLSGGSWLPLFGGPLLVRGLSGLLYLRWAAVHSARAALEGWTGSTISQ